MKWIFLAIFAGFLMSGGFGHAIAINDIDGYAKVSHGSSVYDWFSHLDSGLVDGTYDAEYNDMGELRNLKEGNIVCVYQNTQSMTENIASWYSYTFRTTTVAGWFWDTKETALYKLRCSNGCDLKTGLCKPETPAPAGYELYKGSNGLSYRCGECYGSEYDPTGQPCFGLFKWGATTNVEPNSASFFYLDFREAPTTKVCFSGDAAFYFREGDRAVPVYAGVREPGAYFCDSFGRVYHTRSLDGCAIYDGGDNEPIVPYRSELPDGYELLEDNDCASENFGLFVRDPTQFVIYSVNPKFVFYSGDMFYMESENDYAVCFAQLQTNDNDKIVVYGNNAYFCDVDDKMYRKSCPLGCSESNPGFCETDSGDDDSINDEDPKNDDEEIISGQLTFSSHEDSFINYKETACTKNGHYECKKLSKFPTISLLWYCGMDSQLYFTLCPKSDCNSITASGVGYCDIL